MGKHGPDRGFTLIEVAFSGLVFAIAFMGMSASMAQGTRLNDRAREQLSVATVTRSVMARINDTKFEDLVEKYSDKAFEIDGLKPAEGESAVGKVLVEDVDGVEGLKRITLVVLYNSGGTPRTARYTHFVTNALAFGSVTHDGGQTPPEPEPLIEEAAATTVSEG
jgi:hypothetical protein